MTSSTIKDGTKVSDFYIDEDSLNDDDFMITTKDNPFSPFYQWEEWNAFDMQAGYNTCGLMARLVDVDPSAFEFDEVEALEKAMNKVLRLNLTGNYIKVTRNTPNNLTNSVLTGE